MDDHHEPAGTAARTPHAAPAPLTDAETRDLRAAFERDTWAGEWNSLPTAIDRLLAARLTPLEAIAAAVTPKTEQRVRLVPITAYAIRFHGSEEPRTYLGRPADGGPTCEPNADGAAQDGFAMDNYLMWVEERTIYEVAPGDWEVGIPSLFAPA